MLTLGATARLRIEGGYQRVTSDVVEVRGELRPGPFNMFVHDVKNSQCREQLKAELYGGL